jgi:hypothetical protein
LDRTGRLNSGRIATVSYGTSLPGAGVVNDSFLASKRFCTSAMASASASTTRSGDRSTTARRRTPKMWFNTRVNRVRYCQKRKCAKRRTGREGPILLKKSVGNSQWIGPAIAGAGSRDPEVVGPRPQPHFAIFKSRPRGPLPLRCRRPCSTRLP